MPTDASIDDNYDTEQGQRINLWVGVGNPKVRNGIVAIGIDYANHSDSPRLDANMALIAAAPDLYEALAEARLIVANLPHDESLFLAKIDAALVKARGDA